jgi:hypothetical protein
MRHAVSLMVVLLAIVGCAAPAPTPSVTSEHADASPPATRPEASSTASEQVPVARWQVDIVNRQREVIVSINAVIDTDHPSGAAWAWLVPVGPTLTLLDEPVARQTVVEIIDPTPCEVLDRAEVPAGSATLFLDAAGAVSHHRLTVEQKATGPGHANTDYVGGCSG